MILCFDTETTGKANFRTGPDDPFQPHLVQLGTILLDEHYKPRAELNLIVQPDGWSIPAEASSVHGITTELALAYGLPLSFVLDAFSHLLHRAKIMVAHNFDFDDLVLATAFFRARGNAAYNSLVPHPQESRCTMNAMTPICQLPGPYGYKWPKLQEAYRHCFKEDFDGAHDAMADVRACARIYRWLMERAAPPPIPEAPQSTAPV